VFVRGRGSRTWATPSGRPGGRSRPSPQNGVDGRTRCCCAWRTRDRRRSLRGRSARERGRGARSRCPCPGGWDRCRGRPDTSGGRGVLALDRGDDAQRARDMQAERRDHLGRARRIWPNRNFQCPGGPKERRPTCCVGVATTVGQMLHGERDPEVLAMRRRRDGSWGTRKLMTGRRRTLAPGWPPGGRHQPGWRRARARTWRTLIVAICRTRRSAHGRPWWSGTWETRGRDACVPFVHPSISGIWRWTVKAWSSTCGTWPTSMTP